MTWRRWNFLLWPFIAPLTFLLLYHFLATTWSNRCDPDNATFYAMKADPITGFHAPGQLFTWEGDGPDNSWMCGNATLSITHVGPNVDEMFDATRGDMTRNGWSEDFPIPGEDFAIYYKTIVGARYEAEVKKGWFGVDVFMSGPASAHFGEYGFS